MKWIKSENELPPLNTHVIATDGKDKYWVAVRWIQETAIKQEFFHSVICSCCDPEYDERPKYWMPLPELPKE